MQRIRELRAERGLTQVRLAVAADMNPATLNRIEQGKANPNIKTLERLAEALGVGLVDLLVDDSPKAQASLWPDEGLGRRENVYETWAKFVNQFAERWERKIVEGNLDHGSIMEFGDVLEDLTPIVERLGLEERREQPAGYEYTFGPLMDAAFGRLTSLLNPLIEAAAKQVEDNDLARLRRRREQMASEQVRAASG